MVVRRLPGMQIKKVKNAFKDKESEADRVARLNKGLGSLAANGVLKNPAWQSSPVAKAAVNKEKGVPMARAAGRFSTPGPTNPWTKELTDLVNGKKTRPTKIKPALSKPGRFSTPGPVNPWTKELTSKVKGASYNAVLRRMKRNK